MATVSRPETLSELLETVPQSLERSGLRFDTIVCKCQTSRWSARWPNPASQLRSFRSEDRRGTNNSDWHCLSDVQRKESGQDRSCESNM